MITRSKTIEYRQEQECLMLYISSRYVRFDTDRFSLS